MDENAIDEVIRDFQACHELANRMAAHFPEAKDVWTGTVSERLNRLFDLMLDKVDWSNQ